MFLRSTDTIEGRLTAGAGGGVGGRGRREGSPSQFFPKFYFQPERACRRINVQRQTLQGVWFWLGCGGSPQLFLKFYFYRNARAGVLTFNGKLCKASGLGWRCGIEFPHTLILMIFSYHCFVVLIRLAILRQTTRPRRHLKV